MMFLHNDRELFSEVIYSTAAALNLPVAIVEKDYYVTMILKQLAENVPECVFKGGTSLSKCFHIINRFSEDIRFVAAKTLVGYGMDIMLNIFSICNGVVSDMAAGMGGISQAMVTLPG
ncbi:nucleotidyl transferase AbiEii/AbiGii toxin family protein, partial [Gemmiger sp.]|uniref:nucleotidyl transferase AbiEii/AbiGii toxin family protein n=1 Tax=Gemmiger sp. TaxID=2049027 RepID=UPI003AB4868D